MGRSKKYTKPKKPASAPRTPRDDPSSDVIQQVVEIDDKAATRRTLLRAELAADVDGALEAIRDFGLDAVIVGGQGLRDRAKALKKAGVAVIVTDVASTSWSRTSAMARRDEGLGAALVAAGLHPAIATGASGSSRFLRLLVAREIGEGMDAGNALSAVTSWAADAAGVARTTGSLVPGKRADVVVWDGDPFSAATRAEHVFVAGEEVDLEGD
jgi:imidazolonepropionase-like amidohydrolase